MEKQRLLEQTDHRPWPVPDRPWLMEQVWHDLSFQHWPIRMAEIRPSVPEALEIDQFDGQAWLGMVPFWMSGIRRRGWPPIPGHHTFPELNVRTYVRWRGQPGVWFFSLDTSNRLAVWMARRYFHLPYSRADIELQVRGNAVGFTHRRRKSSSPPTVFSAQYQPTRGIARASPASLEHWLTERYRLFAIDKRQRLWAGDIHHLPWPLQAAECKIEENSMAACHGIRLPDVAPLSHFSRRLEVLIWSVERLPI